MLIKAYVVDMTYPLLSGFL